MAIDITTTKEETSSDFGTRLLTSVQESNRAKEKAFRKRQKRDERDEKLWGVAGTIGIGLGDSFFKNQTDAFLNTELMTNKVLTDRNAYKLAYTTTEEDKKALSHKEGYTNYFTAQGIARARADIQRDFGAEGTYSKHQFEETLLAAGQDIGEKLQKNHERRLELTNTYLSSIGGIDAGQGVFLSEIKKHTPDTLVKGITQMLGKFIGLTPNQRISTRATKIFNTAEKLVQFQDLYKETGDETIAKILTAETPKNIRNPAVVFSDEIKFHESPDPVFGGPPIKRGYLTVTTYSRKTRTSNKTWMFVDGQNNPTGETMTPAFATQIKSFDSAAAVVANDDKLITRYEIAYQALPEKIMEDIDKRIQKKVEAQFKSNATGSARGDATAGFRKRLISRIGGAARIIQSESGLGEAEADKIAMNMFIKNYDTTGLNAFQDGAGVMAPYATLNAMIDTQADARITDKHISNMIGPKGRDLIRSYLNASSSQRLRMHNNFKTFLGKGEKSRLVSEVSGHLIEIQQLANFIADNDFGNSISLDQKIDVAQRLMGHQIREIEELGTNTKPGDPVVKINPDDKDGVWEWVMDHPGEIATAVSIGLMFTPPGWVGGAITATGIAALNLGSRSLVAAKTAWKLKKPFYDWVKKKAKGQFHTKDIDTQIGIKIPGKLDKVKASAALVLTVPPAVEALGSLLSRPEEENTPVVIPETINVPESVEEKVSFVGDIFGDSANEIEFMKGVVNQESNFGANPNTYNMASDGSGRFGVAQVDRAAFNQVQKKLRDKTSSIFKYIKLFKDQTDVDLTTISYADLKEDVFSIAIGRLYLKQLNTETIPATLEGQAAYWKKYYNTSSGKGKIEDFITTNRTE